MANPIKGEVAFEAGGERYKLVLNTYGLAAAERHIGKPFQAAIAEGLGIDAVLGIFYGGLLRHHDLSLKQAGDVVDDIGMARAAEIIQEAVRLAFPDAEGDENPRKAKAAGTGKAS